MESEGDLSIVLATVDRGSDSFVLVRSDGEIPENVEDRVCQLRRDRKVGLARTRV
jgi:hypothetical protein